MISQPSWGGSLSYHHLMSHVSPVTCSYSLQNRNLSHYTICSTIM